MNNYSEAWESDESFQEWLPAFDVRRAVLSFPPGLPMLDEFPWHEFPYGGDRRIRFEEALQGLGERDESVASNSLATLRDLTNTEGNTSGDAAVAVPFLLRLAKAASPRLRSKILKLVGELARCQSYRYLARDSLLRASLPAAIFDAYGYLENWAVTACRIMVGRDAALLVEMLADNEASVRTYAAYVLATGFPATSEVSDALRGALDIEGIDHVKTSLIIARAQNDLARGRDAHALTVTEALWSDSARAFGDRVGGTIAWLGLTTKTASAELRSLLDEFDADDVRDILSNVPWLAWKKREDLAKWLHDLPDAWSPAW
jgi:hypothetical protein